MPTPQQHALTATPSVDIPAARARCSEPACAYPAAEDGLCRSHLRDRVSQASPVGCCAGQLLPLAPVHIEDARPPAGDKKPYQRCTQKKVVPKSDSPKKKYATNADRQRAYRERAVIAASSADPMLDRH
jgi:hypothetical protein